MKLSSARVCTDDDDDVDTAALRWLAGWKMKKKNRGKFLFVANITLSLSSRMTTTRVSSFHNGRESDEKIDSFYSQLINKCVLQPPHSTLTCVVRLPHIYFVLDIFFIAFSIPFSIANRRKFSLCCVWWKYFNFFLHFSFIRTTISRNCQPPHSDHRNGTAPKIGCGGRAESG